MKPFERYRDYVAGLEREGKTLPTNQFGDLNFTQIASDCGMRRQWFSENSGKVFGSEGKTLKQIISDDFTALGTDQIQPKDVSETLAKRSEAKSKEVNRLRKNLNLKLNEIEALREENEQLKAENRLLKAKCGEEEDRIELLRDTGRSFNWNV